MPTNLQLVPGTLPSGYCPTTWQDLNNEIVTRAVAVFPNTLNTFNYGSSTPAVDDRDKPWFNTNDGRWYYYLSGVWSSRHPLAAGSVILWGGVIADIDTFDGGAVGTVGDAAGPMWEELTAARARFPVHPGTTAGGTVIAAAGTGGEDEHTLTEAELPAHTHGLDGWLSHSPNSDSETPEFKVAGGPSGTSGISDDILDTRSTGGGDPHNNLPPYYGIYLIRRTARIYYSA